MDGFHLPYMCPCFVSSARGSAGTRVEFGDYGWCWWPQAQLQVGLQVARKSNRQIEVRVREGERDRVCEYCGPVCVLRPESKEWSVMRTLVLLWAKLLYFKVTGWVDHFL